MWGEVMLRSLKWISVMNPIRHPAQKAGRTSWGALGASDDRATYALGIQS